MPKITKILLKNIIREALSEVITQTPHGQLGEDDSTELPPTTVIPTSEVTDQAPQPPGGGSRRQSRRPRRPIRRHVRELAQKLKERIRFDEATGKWTKNEDFLREKEVPVKSNEPDFIESR